IVWQPWRYGTWRALVLDHVVVGALARRLLWRVDGRLCGYAAGALRPLGDTTESTIGDAARVLLWEPGTSPPDEALAAREWLAHQGIEQPSPRAGGGVRCPSAPPAPPR